MPRDATNYAGGHTSALGELFIADEWGGVQAKVYEVDSGTFLRSSGALIFVEHALPQNTVGASLVSLAALLEPSDDIGIEAHGDGLLYGSIKPAADRVFPCIWRELGDIGGIDLFVGHGGEAGKLALLPGSERWSLRSHWSRLSSSPHF